MPKKLTTNSKAVEARARKEEKKRAETERIEKEKEDEYWKDDDKYVQRKANRKAEAEKKKQEELEKKALKKQLYEEEMSSIKASNKGTGPTTATKVTRAQIETRLEKQAAEKEKQQTKDRVSTPPPLEENINRVLVEGEEARSVEDAIRVLSVKEPEVDRHPEKRMKAAYTAFEERMLPELKNENPNLRLSQIKQLVKKAWMKSPENPMNQIHAIYNQKP